jgi:hypothetical protein
LWFQRSHFYIDDILDNQLKEQSVTTTVAVFEIDDILDNQLKEQYTLKITKSKTHLKEDELYIGYLKLNKITV